jgi:hypothetical protein
MPGKAAACIAISSPIWGGCPPVRQQRGGSPPVVRPRHRRPMHPADIQIQPNLPPENSNRESADYSSRRNNDPKSNRENEHGNRLIRQAFQIKNSNRESADDSARRINDPNSNREKEHGSPTSRRTGGSLLSNPPTFRPRVRRSIHRAEIRIHQIARRKTSNQETKTLDFFPKITCPTKTNSIKHPQSLFRLERTPTYCFQ